MGNGCRAVGITKCGIGRLILSNRAVSPSASNSTVHAELSRPRAITVATVLGATIVTTKFAHAVINYGTVKTRVGEFRTSTICRESGTNGDISMICGPEDKGIFSLHVYRKSGAKIYGRESKGICFILDTIVVFILDYANPMSSSTVSPVPICGVYRKSATGVGEGSSWRGSGNMECAGSVSV